MKKYLLLALAALLFPHLASAITPRLGHYEGTAVSGGIQRKISFDLKESLYFYEMTEPHLPPNIFNHKASPFGRFNKLTQHQCTFNKHDITHIVFDGHAKWESDTKVAGDFREYLSILKELNTYYTWHAHWVHN